MLAKLHQYPEAQILASFSAFAAGAAVVAWAINGLEASDLQAVVQSTTSIHASGVDPVNLLMLQVTQSDRQATRVPHITVKTRQATAAYERQFGCQLQTDTTPNTSQESRATPSQQACAQLIASAIAHNSYGWGRQQMKNLTQLWTNESNWSANAKNPTSDAYGIPQAMMNLHGSALEQEFGTGYAAYTKNPVSQMQWGLEYIHDKYGTPAAANQFWHEQCRISRYKCNY